LTVKPRPVIDAKEIAFAYPDDRCPVLSGVGLSVETGERVALVGPSGCGKTTLLRLLEGSLQMQSGNVERMGRTVMVYQDLRLVEEASVLQNVMNGGLREMKTRAGRERVRARALELIEEVGLTDASERTVGKLSGGQRRRVALARALCAEPEVLLADEPFTNLDRATAESMLRLMVKLQEHHGFALVCSVHDPHLAAKFDRHIELCPLEPALCNVVNRQSAAVRPRWTRSPWLLAVGAVVVLLATIGIFRDAPNPAQALENAGQLAAGMLPLTAEAWRSVPWDRLLPALVDTLQMALVGTAIGAAVSFPLALLAGTPGGKGFLGQAALAVANVVRTVPALLWALLAVAAVGIGSVAGVLALAAYSAGYLTRLFLEEIENNDPRPALALMQMGANKFQALRHGLLKTSAPGMWGAGFFVFEYNVRSASVLGVVGAGGIGAELIYLLEWRRLPEFFIGLLLVVATVMLLDAASRRLRKNLAARRGS
jgi:phosphonate transport system permease protein